MSNPIEKQFFSIDFDTYNYNKLNDFNDHIDIQEREQNNQIQSVAKSVLNSTSEKEIDPLKAVMESDPVDDFISIVKDAISTKDYSTIFYLLNILNTDLYNTVNKDKEILSETSKMSAEIIINNAALMKNIDILSILLNNINISILTNKEERQQAFIKILIDTSAKILDNPKLLKKSEIAQEILHALNSAIFNIKKEHLQTLIGLINSITQIITTDRKLIDDPNVNLYLTIIFDSAITMAADTTLKSQLESSKLKMGEL